MHCMFSFLNTVYSLALGDKHVVYHKDFGENSLIAETVRHSWNCRPLGQNPFGLVTDAWIAVQGYLMPARLRTTRKVSAIEPSWDGLKSMYVLQFAGQEQTFNPDVFIEEATLCFAADGTPTKKARRAHPPSQAKRNFAIYFSQVDVPVMLRGLRRTVEAGQNGRGYRNYLVLAKSVRHPGCFERLRVLAAWYTSAGEWPPVLDRSLWTTVALV